MIKDKKTYGQNQKYFQRALLFLVLLLTALTASSASAQNYSFEVDNLQMEVFIQPDGSAQIIYDISFSNSTFGHPIDIIDIGTPTDDYDISNMSASIDGTPLNDIRVSEYISTGVEVHLGSKEIPSGGIGVFHFEFTIPDMVFSDITKKGNASFQISPTWFDSQVINGTTNLQIAVHMLEGITPEEVLYQDQPFTNKAIFKNHVVVYWEFPAARLTGANKVGVSFPSRGLTNFVEMNLLQFAFFWFKNSTNARMIAGILFLILFSILYFRFTGGTGVTLWLILVGILVWIFIVSPGLHLFLFIPLIPLLVLNENKLQNRKKTYLPAIAQVEGGGIKRGLTAPEAATLLEMPINKVLTLIIFGMLKKGILSQTSATPLEVAVDPNFQGSKISKIRERIAFRRKAAQQAGVVIHNYEHRFLDAIEGNPGKAVKDIDMSEGMEWFLKYVASRMKGFDLSDTQEYYQKIVDRAWKYAKSIGEIPERERVLDKHMEWVLMHDDYPTVFHTPRHVYVPQWIRGTSSGKSGGFGKSSSGGGAASPSFGEVAAGFSGWAENTMGSLASSIMPGSLTVSNPKGGIIDLSGIDKATGDFFDALASSSGSGGGGGGGGSCACACAGCACACACAGGGR